MNDDVYSDPKGWRSEQHYRWRRNPNRAWYNAPWQPIVIEQQRYVKLVSQGAGGVFVAFYKWVSLHPTIKVEDSDETV